MTLSSATLKEHKKIKHNCCSHYLCFPLRAAARLSLAICSIIRFVFSALRCAYERVVCSSAKKERKELDRYFDKHKEEIVQEFLQLGIMNVRVDMSHIHDLNQKMNGQHTQSLLFVDPENRKKTLNSCSSHFDILNTVYLSGVDAFYKIQNAVKACAQESILGTTVSTIKDLLNLLVEGEYVDLNTLPIQRELFFTVLISIAEAHKEHFLNVFQENIPTV